MGLKEQEVGDEGGNDHHYGEAYHGNFQDECFRDEYGSRAYSYESDPYYEGLSTVYEGDEESFDGEPDYVEQERELKRQLQQRGFQIYVMISCCCFWLFGFLVIVGLMVSDNDVDETHTSRSASGPGRAPSPGARPPTVWTPAPSVSPLPDAEIMSPSIDPLLTVTNLPSLDVNTVGGTQTPSLTRTGESFFTPIPDNARPHLDDIPSISPARVGTSAPTSSDSEELVTDVSVDRGDQDDEGLVDPASTPGTEPSDSTILPSTTIPHTDPENTGMSVNEEDTLVPTLITSTNAPTFVESTLNPSRTPTLGQTLPPISTFSFAPTTTSPTVHVTSVPTQDPNTTSIPTQKPITICAEGICGKFATCWEDLRDEVKCRCSDSTLVDYGEDCPQHTAECRHNKVVNFDSLKCVCPSHLPVEDRWGYCHPEGSSCRETPCKGLGSMCIDIDIDIDIDTGSNFECQCSDGSVVGNREDCPKSTLTNCSPNPCGSGAKCYLWKDSKGQSGAECECGYLNIIDFGESCDNVEDRGLQHFFRRYRF